MQFFISKNSFKVWGLGWEKMTGSSSECWRVSEVWNYFVHVFPSLGAKFKVQPQSSLQMAVPWLPDDKLFQRRDNIHKNLPVYTHRYSRIDPSLQYFTDVFHLWVTLLSQHWKNWQHVIHSISRLRKRLIVHVNINFASASKFTWVVSYQLKFWAILIL